jgi:hypothetical protein
MILHLQKTVGLRSSETETRRDHVSALATYPRASHRYDFYEPALKHEANSPPHTQLTTYSVRVGLSKFVHDLKHYTTAR